VTRPARATNRKTGSMDRGLLALCFGNFVIGTGTLVG
jgi:hypothetical protein